LVLGRGGVAIALPLAWLPATIESISVSLLAPSAAIPPP
jgi:hypothetical protein